jgi:hypothetical protein
MLCRASRRYYRKHYPLCVLVHVRTALFNTDPEHNLVLAVTVPAGMTVLLDSVAHYVLVCSQLLH